MFVTDTFEIKIAGVPVSFDGAITVNLDANGDGQLLAGNGNADQLLHGDLQALPAVFADIDVGVNGIVDLAVPNLFKIDLQLADVTTVYDGPRVGLWVSGTSGLKDPLAGSALQGFVITNHDAFNAYLFGDGRDSVCSVPDKTSSAPSSGSWSRWTTTVSALRLRVRSTGW